MNEIGYGDILSRLNTLSIYEIYSLKYWLELELEIKGNHKEKVKWKKEFFKEIFENE